MGEHARLLRAAGHDVEIVAGRGDARIVPELDSRHPRVERLTSALARGEGAAGEFAELASTIREALARVLAGRDAVVAHNVMTMPFNLPLARALVDLHLPVVAWTHDIALLNPRYREYQRSGEPYDLMRRPQPRCTYVAISEVRRRELAHLFGLAEEAVPVVPNGVEADAFLGISAATRDLLERAGAAGARPLILVPLRVTRRKRLELAVQAAAELRPRHPSLGVVVTGPLGPHSADNQAYWRSLHRLRADLGLDGVVAFLHELAEPGGAHPVSAASVAELYRLADAILVPSESEGFGLPVVEAALSRTPVVCADIDVLREAGGDALHLFPADGSPSQVARAIESALSVPLARDRRRALDRYSWPALVPAIEATIQRAVEAAHA